MFTLSGCLFVALAVAMASKGEYIDPCLPNKHTVLNDMEFRSTGYKMAPGEVTRCDRRLAAGWYRMRSKAGEDMPTTCPAQGACGTLYPVWMNGTVPPKDGKIHERLAATRYENDCHMIMTPIKVKNCGDFRVYNLESLDACPAAYCFGDGSICPPGYTSRSGYTPCIADPCLSNKHVVLENMESRSTEYKMAANDTDRCDRRLDTNWYHVVSKAGEDMPTTCPAKDACGTTYPVWMNGTIPPQDGKIHDRVAATRDDVTCSRLTRTIQVKNCGSFRVYYLSSVDACPSAYCFGEGSKCPQGYSSESGYTPCRIDGDPCLSSQHTVLYDMESRSTGYKMAPGEVVRCDRRLAARWYRMRSKAGEDMPTTCPAKGTCGTLYPVWMNGSIPSDDGEIHDRIAATFFQNDCSYITTPIQVKNCGHYRVYKLTSLDACPSAFCFGNGTLCPPETTSATGYAPCINETDAHDDVTTTPPMIDQSEETTWPDDHNATIFGCGPFGGLFDKTPIYVVIASCVVVLVTVVAGLVLLRTYITRRRISPTKNTKLKSMDSPPPYCELPPPVSVYYGDLCYPDPEYPEKKPLPEYTEKKPANPETNRYSALQVQGI